MPLTSERRTVAGPAGALECVIEHPVAANEAAEQSVAPRGVAVWCHPHPVHGGTMDNKVITTLSRTFVQLGWQSVRFNFRGVGGSAGHWDEGRGEVEDTAAVIDALRGAGQPLVLGGFSFGGYVATRVAARLLAQGGHHAAQRLVLVAPAAGSFELAPVPANTLVVHGEVDDVIPLAAVLDWARPQSLPITLVPGAGHFFHGQLTLLRHIVQAAWA